MRPTRAIALRGALAVVAVFIVIMFVRTNPGRYFTVDESENIPGSDNNDNTPNGLQNNAPISPPLQPWEDMRMTPFGHANRLLIDCPNSNATQCLDFLQRHEPMHIRNTSDELMVLHTAWTGGMVPVHQFLLYSYLATQNLSKSILVYWLEASEYHNFTSNPMLAPFIDHPNIRFKCFNLSDLAKDTPLDLSRTMDDKRREDVTKLLSAKGALWGDLVRMLILYKYGGIYVDVDIILLRPMDPFMAGGKSVKAMFLRIIGRKDNFHPWKLFDIINEQGLPVVMYPAGYFDPVWNVVEKGSPKENLPYDKFWQFFSKVNGEFKFWEGAYTYHIHNQYQTQRWEEYTWAGRLLTQFQDEIKMNKYNSYELIGIKPEHADLLVEKCT